MSGLKKKEMRQLMILEFRSGKNLSNKQVKAVDKFRIRYGLGGKNNGEILDMIRYAKRKQKDFYTP